MLLHSFSVIMIFSFAEVILSFNANRILPTRNYWKHSSKYSLQSELKLAVAVGSGVNDLGPVKKNLKPIRSDKKSLLNAHIDLLINIWQSVCLSSKEQGWLKSGDEEEEFIDFVLDDYYGNGILSEENNFDSVRKRASGLIQHFQFCKDTCAADNVFLMATQNDEEKDLLRLSRANFAMLSEEESNDEDWGNFDSTLMESDEVSEQLVFPIEENDSVVLTDSKSWVQKVIADFAVCPFTIDPNRAGIPLGGVRYSISRALEADEALLKFWQEVRLLLQTPEKDMATVLLVFPELELFGNYELFEAYCDCLSDALTASSLGLESAVQLVFFHPKFQFRDGNDRTGADSRQGAANFARRAPWPMINLLRTSQVRSAQKGVPTGQVYQQNEERLAAVGAGCLQDMLFSRNWTQLPSHFSQIKSDTQLALANKQIVLNLDNPLLTSLSDGSCPFSHAANMPAVKAKTEKQAAPPKQSDKPVKPPQPQKKQANPNPTLTSPKAQQKPAAATGAAAEPVDYLKLAEDVDEWFATWNY